MSQYCVTALKKDWAILCGLRLVLEHLGTSESAIITLKEYYSFNDPQKGGGQLSDRCFLYKRSSPLDSSSGNDAIRRVRMSICAVMYSTVFPLCRNLHLQLRR